MRVATGDRISEQSEETEVLRQAEQTGRMTQRGKLPSSELDSLCGFSIVLTEKPFHLY